MKLDVSVQDLRLRARVMRFRGRIGVWLSGSVVEVGSAGGAKMAQQYHPLLLFKSRKQKLASIPVFHD